MSTMLNTQEPKMLNTQEPKETQQSSTPQQAALAQRTTFGMYFGPGLAAALNFVVAVLAKTEVQLEQEQRKLQESIIKNSSKIALAARSNTISAGHLAFIEGLASGIGQIVGGVGTLGTIGVAEYTDTRNAQMKEIEEEQTGVKGYQDALGKGAEPSVSEKGIEAKSDKKVDADESQKQVNEEAKKEEKAQCLEEEAIENRNAIEESTTKSRDEHDEKIAERLKALHERASFKNANPAEEVAYKTEGDEVTPAEEVIDKEMFKQLTDLERSDLSKALDERAKNLAGEKSRLIDEQWKRRQMVSTLVQSGASVLSGSGSAVAASTKVDQAVENANAQLNQSTYQNMNEIEKTQQNIGDQELQAAEKFIDTATAISSGDRYQG